MLTAVLYLQLLQVVNQLHFKWLVTGIPGVAPANLLFLVGLLLMQGQEETVQTPPFLKGAIPSLRTTPTTTEAPTAKTPAM